MEIDYTGRRAGSHRAPKVPAQRVHSPSMPIRVAAKPKRARPPKPKRRWRWGLILVPLGVLAAVGAVLLTLYTLPGPINDAKAGDCASFDRSNAQNPYATVRCGSSAATFAVLQVIEGDGSCRTVAGATRSTTSFDGNTRREVCMGPKDADPAEAVNVAQVGDCLTGASGQERRVPCDSPAATARILLRVNDVSTTQVRTTCDRVPGANSVYSWSWDSDDGTGPAQASYQTDAVFCLGPNS
jgi:hypothetical protein